MFKKYNKFAVGLVMGLALGLLSQRASAAVLEDNFDDGTLADFPSPNVAGSALINPGTGGNPNGYLQASREGGNTGYNLSEKYTGDWGTLIGSDGIVVSSDIRVEDAFEVEFIRFYIYEPTFSHGFKYDITMGGPFPTFNSSDGWQTFSVPIDVTWTDEEAATNGWARDFGTQPFAQVLANVKGPFTYWIAVGSSTLTGLDNFRIEPAVTAVPGDFDADGDVDGADFVVWQTNFPTASEATLAEGDADGDGDVDGADFVVWQTNFPFTPGPGLAPVPEPASLVLAMAGCLAMLTWRRRRCLRE